MVNKHKVGIVLGVLLGGMHMAWSLLVFLGFAQTTYDFVMWAHMLHSSATIGPFDMAAAITLVIIAAVVGYIIGYIGAWVWNKTHSR